MSVYPPENTQTPTSTGSYEAYRQAYGPTMSTAGAGPGLSGFDDTTQYVLFGDGWTTSYHTEMDFEKGEKYSVSDGRSRALKEVSLDDALKRFDKMDIDKKRDTLRLLAIGGFAGALSLDEIDEFVEDASLTAARTAYTNLLQTASDYYMLQDHKTTPNDVLKLAIEYRLRGTGIAWDGSLDSFDDGLGDFLEGTEEEGPIPGTTTSTTSSTSVDFHDPLAIKNMVRSTIANALGRDPTQGEYEDFLSGLNAAERANPSTTTATTTTTSALDQNGQLYMADQNTSQTSHQGITGEGLAQLAYEKAQRQPDYAEWQAMGVYAPALFAALGATVPGV